MMSVLTEALACSGVVLSILSGSGSIAARSNWQNGEVSPNARFAALTIATCTGIAAAVSAPVWLALFTDSQSYCPLDVEFCTPNVAERAGSALTLTFIALGALATIALSRTPTRT